MKEIVILVDPLFHMMSLEDYRFQIFHLLNERRLFLDFSSSPSRFWGANLCWLYSLTIFLHFKFTIFRNFSLLPISVSRRRSRILRAWWARMRATRWWAAPGRWAIVGTWGARPRPSAASTLTFLVFSFLASCRDPLLLTASSICSILRLFLQLS